MALCLTSHEETMLSGRNGPGVQMAMRIVVRMAEVLEVSELLPITQAHIDGCALMSDSSLEFAEKLASSGARVSVPTTLNMIPLDLQNWKKQGVPAEFGHKASRIADAYIKMNCIPTWTCAPYQGFLTPSFGQQIAWGESNAIIYANSVIGARTNRYADFMDICAAITGRVPKQGLHLKENRRGQVLIRLMGIDPGLFAEDTFYPVLGYLVGKRIQDRIPVIEGLDTFANSDQLKALGAAAASSGGIGLFHIIGLTPEAPTLEDAFQGSEPDEIVEFGMNDLLKAMDELSHDAGEGDALDAVVLGCPHFSYTEFQALTEIIHKTGGTLPSGVRLIILTNQLSMALLERGGLKDFITKFGAEIILDTCVFHSPIVSAGAEVIMTNSGKCAYYAPGELNTRVVFGNLEECIHSAMRGKVTRLEGAWKSL